MTKFPAWPVVQNLEEHLWRLMDDYVYEWTKDGKTYRVTVWRNFVFDFASVPRAVWVLIDKMDAGPSSLLHDWLYQWQGRLPGGAQHWLIAGEWVEVRADWTREEADRLMGRMMRESGVARWRRRLIFRVVRIFGRGAWRSVDTPWNVAD